jgi:hypothetical protein
MNNKLSVLAHLQRHFYLDLQVNSAGAGGSGNTSPGHMLLYIGMLLDIKIPTGRTTMRTPWW